MSTKRLDSLYVQDMLDYGGRAIEYTTGLAFQEFYLDNKTMDATIRCLEVMGEACRQMSEDFKVTHPEIPWARIKGFRNRAIHEYIDLDLGTVWKVVTKDLPVLLPQLKALL